MKYFTKILLIIVIILSVSCIKTKMFTHTDIICCGAEQVFIIGIDYKDAKDIKK